MRELIQALQQVLEATQDEQKAKESYQGYDWGYSGYEYIKRREEAEDEFCKALNKVIDARISAHQNKPFEL